MGMPLLAHSSDGAKKRSTIGPNVLLKRVMNETDATDRFSVADLIKERNTMQKRSLDEVADLQKSFQQLVKIEALKHAGSNHAVTYLSEEKIQAKKGKNRRLYLTREHLDTLFT